MPVVPLGQLLIKKYSFPGMDTWDHEESGSSQLLRVERLDRKKIAGCSWPQLTTAFNMEEIYIGTCIMTGAPLFRSASY